MRFILGLVLLFSFKAYSYEDFRDNYFEDRSLVEELQETIHFKEGNRIYFKEDFLKITSHGIFLLLRNGREIPIQKLCSSNVGCYSSIDGLQKELLSRLSPDIFPTCYECGKMRRILGECTNPDCPLFQVNQERKKQEEVEQQKKNK